jgi:hypothetical protein
MWASRRMRRAGHVARIGEKRNAYRLVVGKPEGKRTNWFFMMPSIATKFQYVVAIDGIIKNQLDRCATGCNTQREGDH